MVCLVFCAGAAGGGRLAEAVVRLVVEGLARRALREPREPQDARVQRAHSPVKIGRSVKSSCRPHKTRSVSSSFATDERICYHRQEEIGVQ